MHISCFQRFEVTDQFCLFDFCYASSLLDPPSLLSPLYCTCSFSCLDMTHLLSCHDIIRLLSCLDWTRFLSCLDLTPWTRTLHCLQPESPTICSLNVSNPLLFGSHDHHVYSRVSTRVLVHRPSSLLFTFSLALPVQHRSRVSPTMLTRNISPLLFPPRVSLLAFTLSPSSSDCSRCLDPTVHSQFRPHGSLAVLTPRFTLRVLAPRITHTVMVARLSTSLDPSVDYLSIRPSVDYQSQPSINHKSRPLG